MLRLISANREKIEVLCRRFHVRRLDLFGSAVRDDFDPRRSDLDFLVEFDQEAPQRALDAYFGLKEGLEELLGMPVDLIMPGAVRNPFIQATIAEDRQVLYAA